MRQVVQTLDKQFVQGQNICPDGHLDKHFFLGQIVGPQNQGKKLLTKNVEMIGQVKREGNG